MNLINDIPLVSVITPTYNRHDLLINRCIPSVYDQIYPRVEHVIVSDGYDRELSDKLAARNTRLDYINPHEASNAARRKGLELARGELIAHLDDDDAYREIHISTLVKAFIDDPEIQWAYTFMIQHFPNRVDNVIGTNPPQYMGIGTPMIMHRRELAEVAFFGAEHHCDDWNMVNQWLAAGVKYACIPVVTIDVWPAVPWIIHGARQAGRN